MFFGNSIPDCFQRFCFSFIFLLAISFFQNCTLVRTFRMSRLFALLIALLTAISIVAYGFYSFRVFGKSSITASTHTVATESLAF